MKATKGKLIWLQSTGAMIELLTAPWAVLQAKKTELVRNGFNSNVLKIMYL